MRLEWNKTLEERHRTYHDEGRRISYKGNRRGLDAVEEDRGTGVPR
ncbi:hypothetical protein [Saccharopolyspora hattusasensis]